jgi:hypothetical protein
MDKQKVIKLFGGVEPLAAAMGVKRHAIYMMPDCLSSATSDRIVGVCVRNGIDPAPLLESEKEGSS